MARNSLKLRTSVRTGLSGSIRNSLEILALHQLDLQQKIESALAENPFLEEEAPPALNVLSLSSRKEAGAKGDFFENSLSAGENLQETLNRQLYLLELDEATLNLCLAIISAIDDRGFSQLPHMEIASGLGMGPKVLRSALRVIRALQPTGVGAEDLWQSLEWQAEARYREDPFLPDLISWFRVSGHSFFGKEARSNKLRPADKVRIADTFHISLEEVDKRLAMLARLTPYPAESYRTPRTEIIVPEIIYNNTRSGVEIRVREQLLPSVRINTELLDSFRKIEKKGEWTEKLIEAEGLMAALRYRHDNLEKFAASLLHFQPEFFERGTSALRPLNLADVAARMQVHISTVSRIISRKYCQTKWGIFPLKFFFPPRIKGFGDTSYSTDDLKNAILALLAHEDRKAPMSDEEITRKLVETGYDVKRRTVAKYRTLLHIPGSSARRM